MAKHPKAKLKIYVVWESMLPTDPLRRTRDDLITDERAIHFKDTDRVSGTWFTKKVKDCPTLGEVAWDAFYLYGPEAKWEDVPSPRIACGSPVVRDFEELGKAVKILLSPP